MWHALVNTDSPKLKSREISARREVTGVRGTPFFQRGRHEAECFVFVPPSLRTCCSFTNTTHSNYFQFYNDAILGMVRLL
jgi:hypothetical protein